MIPWPVGVTFNRPLLGPRQTSPGIFDVIDREHDLCLLRIRRRARAAIEGRLLLERGLKKCQRQWEMRSYETRLRVGGL
jgi:hypothetical protein